MELAESRDCKSFGVRARKSLHCREWTVQDDSGEGSERGELNESLGHVREHQEKVSRQMDSEEHSDGFLVGNQKGGIGSCLN